jgi:hypothetical protein
MQHFSYMFVSTNFLFSASIEKNLRSALQVLAAPPASDSVMGWRPQLHQRLHWDTDMLFAADGRAFDLTLGTRSVRTVWEDSKVEAVVSGGGDSIFYGDAFAIWKYSLSTKNVRKTYTYEHYFIAVKMTKKFFSVLRR